MFYIFILFIVISLRSLFLTHVPYGCQYKVVHTKEGNMGHIKYLGRNIDILRPKMDFSAHGTWISSKSHHIAKVNGIFVLQVSYVGAIVRFFAMGIILGTLHMVLG